MSEWHDKRSRVEELRPQMVAYYLVGHSIPQTAQEFSVAEGTVYNTLKREGVETRSQTEGNALRWKKEAFRSNQVARRKGQTPWNKGKRYRQRNPPRRRPATTGSGNGMWKGGKTRYSLRIRRLPEYKRWRELVFKRDGYTCVHCGAKTGNGKRVHLHADHFYPFSRILDDYSITSVQEAIECPALWDVVNGRTLCRPCHRQTDTYGTNLSV